MKNFKKIFKKKSTIFIGVGIIIAIAAIVLLVLLTNKVTIDFDTGTTSTIKSITIFKNKTISVPKTPVKEGYVFEGWYLNDVLFNFNTKISKDIVLKARWKESQENYIVTFNSDGGSNIDSVSVKSGDSVIIPATPTKEGYVFVEWQLDGTSYDFNTKINKDITLIAKWIEETEATVTYKVTFNSNGGSKVSSQTIIENGTVTKPTNPTRTGYEFIEWQLSGKTYNFSSKVTKKITIVAVWKEIKQYTVTFNTNGGSKVSSQTIKEDGTVTKPTNPTRTGYEFIEWQLSGKTYNFSSKVNENITITASWKEKEKYTITFNSNGGSSVGTQTVYVGEKVSLPSKPTKTHFTFVGWELNGATYDFNKTVKTNMTLVAKWEENRKCTVTFNSNGGSNVSDKIVYCGESLGVNPTSTRNGYTLDGWYNENNKYNASSTINTNIELTAKWLNNDEIALTNAKTVIKDSYNITKGGQNMGVTSTGCVIIHTNASEIAQIRRGTSDTKVTLNYNIVCGSKTGTDTAKGIIKASTYRYTAEDAGNRTNSYVRISGLTNYLLYKINTSSIIGIYSSVHSSAVVLNTDLANNMDMKLTSDDNTTYVVTAAN